MPQRIDVDLEPWPTSPVMRPVRRDYKRQAASSYQDDPAHLTRRQAVFLRNLIRIVEMTSSDEIPVDFIVGRSHLYLDRGCVKMAVHAGFLLNLVDGPMGVVDSVRLSWDVFGQRRAPAVPE